MKKVVNFGDRMVPTFCKHIQKVYSGKLCLWHEQASHIKQTIEQRKNMVCPKCGGKTEWVKVAV